MPVGTDDRPRPPRAISPGALSFRLLALLPFFLVLSAPRNCSCMAQPGADNRSASTYILRVVFLCDETSRQHWCHPDSTQASLSQDLLPSLDSVASVFPDCPDLNSTCHNSSVFESRNDYFSYTYHADTHHMIIRKDLSQTTSLLANVSFHVLNGNMRTKMASMDRLVTSLSADVMVAVANFSTVQTAAIVADGRRIPLLGYVTDHGTSPSNIQGPTYVSMNPSTEAQGQALTQIIGQFNMKQTTVILEKRNYADGFLAGVRRAMGAQTRDVFNVLALDTDIGTKALKQKLTELSNQGWKVVVLHCSTSLMLRLVTVARSTHLYDSGYAWFLSGLAFSRDPALTSKLPEGLLAIDSFWLGGTPEVMVKSLDYVTSAAACVLGDGQTSEVVRRSDDLDSSLGLASHGVSGGQDPSSVRNVTDFLYSFKRCLAQLLSLPPTTPHNYSDQAQSPQSGSDVRELGYEIPSDAARDNRGPAFNLLNTVEDGQHGERLWAKVGYITASGHRDLKTVLWPGRNIYGPSSNVVKTYRVVTRPAEPFVFINARVSRKEDCLVEVPCLMVDNSSQALLTAVVDDFQSGSRYADQLYSIHCCKGLALEVLNTLSSDLNFRYVVYFVNDTNYGTEVNDVWTGMVGDVINGAADIVAGAFSMTSDRLDVMDFTEPFYQNQFSVVTGEGGSYVSIWAFLSPFSGQVWLCIFLSSIVAGVATAVLEWHSPFGLNPRGRKRTKNYGLGSGLLMVMVLLTGHTINIKAPKSWPGKVIQNVWAGLAIFIMTSYTANLAAYLAGQSAVTAVTSVYDEDLLNRRVAVMPSSAAQSFLEKINPKLAKRARLNPVDSTITAINMLRDRQMDVYLDDTPLLEYGLAKYDKDCKVRFAGPGNGFGSDGYAFGLARQSWLQIPMSNQILWYTESGYIQELAGKYLSRPQCEHFLAGTANPYGLAHTGGLFIILLTAVFLSLIFHVLEHVAYRYLVPWLRRQPDSSFWKTENLAFISQRVFRVVRSEKLYSQKQAAQEMIKIVKQRDFTRLLQKHELQKRRIPNQKRVKTKAEVFQEITANIISYHRQLQSSSDMTDSFDAETERIEDIVADVIDSIESPNICVNNTAFNTQDESDFYLDMLYRQQRKSFGSGQNVDRSFFPFDFQGDGPAQDSQNGAPYRKMSSRSWCFPGRKHENAQVRKRSDSYILYPPSPPGRLRSYNVSTPGSYQDINLKNSSTTRFNNDSGMPQQHSKCNSLRIFTPNGVSYSDAAPSVDVSHRPPSVHLSQPDALDNLHCPSSISSTSSSVQSPSDEKREFSPLSSPSSQDTDEFPGCTDSVNSVRMSPSEVVNQKGRNSLSHEVDLPDNSPHVAITKLQATTSPKIVIQTPLEISVNQLDLCSQDASQHTNHLPPSSLQTHLDPERAEGHFQRQLPRSKSTGQFVQNSPKNNAPVDFLGVEYGRPRAPSYDHLAESEIPAGGSRRDSAFPKVDSRRKSAMSDNEFINQSSYGLNNGIFTIEGASPGTVLRSLRKSSDISPIRTDNSQDQQNNSRRTKSYDKSSSRDYFRRNLKLKDNRVKSTLRHHAMSGYQSYLPADFIDQCTLEALSKEDVLLLWKKSEVDLESRLHEVLAKNRRLGLAIDFLTKRDRAPEAEEV